MYIPFATRRFLAGIAYLLAAGAAFAAFSSEKLGLIDRPYQGESLAFSPDGKRVAYTRYEESRLSLVIADLDRKSERRLPLANDTGKAPRSRLSHLRWANANRLVLVNSNAEIIAIDADGTNPRQLWNRADDGLVNDSYFRREPYIVAPGTPRLLPALPDAPDHVLVESVARIGNESFVNVYRIHIGTGEIELANRDRYLNWQIALYGRGDMLLWPPAPYDVERWATTRGQPTLRDLAAYLFANPNSLMPNIPPDTSGATPADTRARLEQFLTFPPELNETGGINLNGWAASPRTPPPPPPQSQHLGPEDGGSVSADSSTTGRMIYDRQGRPRLLLSENVQGDVRKVRYFKPGARLFEANLQAPDLDAALGQPKAGEFVLTPGNYFGERSYPLGFDYDPDILYIASNVGRDTYAIYALNLATQTRTEIAAVPGVDLATGDPAADADGLLVFDEQVKKLVGIRVTSVRPRTFWLDPELGRLQTDAERALPRYGVEILGWDAARTRYVLRVASEEDPGAILVYRADGNQPPEFLFSRTPWLAGTDLNASSSFSFDTPDGRRLTGFLTLPAKPKANPPPVLIYAEGGPWRRVAPGFNREAEILADLGLVVLRVNYRGTAGFGRSHVTAIQEGVETVPIDDMVSALDWLSSRLPVDRNRVLIMGESFGGYLAMRALQLRPDMFRGGISIDAPTNLNGWAGSRQLAEEHPMYRDGSFERTPPVDFEAEARKSFIRAAKKTDIRPPSGTPTRSLLVIESPNARETTPIASALAALGIGNSGLDLLHFRIGGVFENGTADTRARVFQRIDEFINENLYNFSSSIGTLREVKDSGKAPTNSGTKK